MHEHIADCDFDVDINTTLYVVSSLLCLAGGNTGTYIYIYIYTEAELLFEGLGITRLPSKLGACA